MIEYRADKRLYVTFAPPDEEPEPEPTPEWIGLVADARAAIDAIEAYIKRS